MKQSCEAKLKLNSIISRKKIENNELPLKIIVLVFSGLPVESSDLSV